MKKVTNHLRVNYINWVNIYTILVMYYVCCSEFLDNNKVYYKFYTINYTCKNKRSERCRKRQRACLILNSGSDRVVFAC